MMAAMVKKMDGHWAQKIWPLGPKEMAARVNKMAARPKKDGLIFFDKEWATCKKWRGKLVFLILEWIKCLHPYGG